MGFMNEVAEEAGEQFAYKNVLRRLADLEKEYAEIYGVDIPEMYVEIFEDIIFYLRERIKDNNTINFSPTINKISSTEKPKHSPHLTYKHQQEGH